MTRRVAMLLLVALALLGGCERERRPFRTPVPGSSAAPTDPRLGGNQPALARSDGVQPAITTGSPYAGNAWAVAQGKRLYAWYNCNGCHGGAGGGGIGPPLMDATWRYGAAPADIHASIVRGRPEGMPAFGGHIPDDQVWQLVAYVQSMGRQLRKDVEPSRGDTLSPGPPENARDRQPRLPEQRPPEQPTGGQRP